MKVFSGNANRGLADKVAAYLQVPLGAMTVSRFPDGEINVVIEEDIRGSDCFVIQPTCHPVNENLMELLVTIDAFKRASAKRVTAVIPYYGYARQDRKHEGRVPITAKLVANLLVSAGVDRILAVDLHSAQIQGFFDIPVDHLYAAPILIRHIRDKKLDNLCVVAPDAGSLKMSNAFARRLNAGFAVVDKRRTRDGQVEVSTVVGDVRGKHVVFVDDMISTGTSLLSAYRLVREREPASINILVTHPVFCGNALANLAQIEAQEIIVTDSIPLAGKHLDNLVVLTLSELLGEAIRRIHNNESISKLFI
ncbi:MAG: ribose-phosphate pyrophosphokinase [Planctomycetota bacterium]